MSVLSAPPLQTSMVEVAGERPPRSYLITRVWDQWLLSLTSRIQSAAFVNATKRLTQQAASIASTPFTLSVTASLYRVSWFAHVVQAATTSSSLTVTIGFTDGSLTCSQAGPAV